MSDDNNTSYKISKKMEQGDIDERQNIEIEVQAPSKEDVLELYREAMNQ